MEKITYAQIKCNALLKHGLPAWISENEIFNSTQPMLFSLDADIEDIRAIWHVNTENCTLSPATLMYQVPEKQTDHE